MGKESFLLIAAAEGVALCLFVLGIALLKNRKLTKVQKRLKARIEELKSQLLEAREQAKRPPPPEPKTYLEKLDDQIELTKGYHYDQGSRQDIALDLDPDSPLPRRSAALRHAFLIAEKEAAYDSESEIKWDLLATRYQQIFSFHTDYGESEDGPSSEEWDLLQEELNQSKKRINNLERFKTLYFELEEKWEQAKGSANEQMTEIQTLVENESSKEDLLSALESYQSAYDEVGALIGKGSDEAVAGPDYDGRHAKELARLRNVTVDQHRIINELKDKLAQSSAVEESVEIVESLQGELQKQARYLQEAETCIKLMEDELDNANNEIDQLRARAKQVPGLKKRCEELQRNSDKHDQIVGSLKQENKRLAKKLKLSQEEPSNDSQETLKLKKELSALQGKYNDLEEKFLDLKLSM